MTSAEKHKEICDSVRHYSNLIYQIRTITIAQGLIILGFSLKITSGLPFILVLGIDMLGMLFTAWVCLIQKTYLKDFDTHIEYLREYEKTENISTSWTKFGEEHTKRKEDPMFIHGIRYGIFYILGISYIALLIFHIYEKLCLH